MRGKGTAKEKNGTSGVDQGSSKMSCGRECQCERRARLAYKHAVNQQIAEDEENTNANKPSNEEIANNIVSQNKSQAKKVAQKPVDVDDLVNFIEGNTSTSNKKRAKKERQKQERLEVIKQKHEEEKRLQEAIAKEQQRIKDEERKKEEAEREMTQMSKKQLKKAKQRAKMSAEQGLPTESLPQIYMPHLSSETSQAPSTALSTVSSQLLGNFGSRNVTENPLSSSPLAQLSSQSLGTFGSPTSSSNPLSSLEDLKAQLNNLTTNTMNQLRSGLLKPSLSTNSSNNYTSNVTSNVDPVHSLNQLKAKHQRELEMLQLKHRQAIEEEEMKARYVQKEQPLVKQQNKSPQYPLPQYQPQKDQLNQSMVSPPTMQQSLQRNSKKNKTKGKTPVGNNDGSKQLQAGKLPNISASAAEAIAKAKTSPGNQIRISRNAHGGVDFTTIPADQVKEQAKPVNPMPAKTIPSTTTLGSNSSNVINKNMTLEAKQNAKTINSNNRKEAKPYQFDQPMVRIRRVENPFSSEQTVTISQPQQSKDNPEGEDKLLYTLINGQVLKEKDAPNLIPGAKPMPPNVL